jgi:ABC-type transport system involved in cytochrome c biogenesis permease subunit
MKLLNLERLETMNRRAITLAFPLLTVGLIVAVILDLHGGRGFVTWTNTKLLSIVGLWLVVAILVYLRYAAHARGRNVAIWTIVAFVLMVLSFVSEVHPIMAGGGQ